MKQLQKSVTAIKMTRLINSLLLTILIYAVALLFGHYINPSNEFFSPSFGTHTLMLVLSILVIHLFKRDVHYIISWPKFKRIWKPILYGILTAIVVNMVIAGITALCGGKNEGMKILNNSNFWQIFIFIFIYASIAEELLFRGFLQNILSPLKDKYIKIFKIKLSLPVIIAAIMFGFAHTILLLSGQSIVFVIRIVIFTFTLGLFAGYYQEKYNNNAYAIITHMAGNLMGLLAAAQLFA
ncbi:MAG: CPBP family intramembrane glutamic endopeptidase [Bacteroidales bacterium]